MVKLSVIFWFVFISFCHVSAHICLERSGFFTANSTYDLNRRDLLSSLPSNVIANDGFYTTSTGEDPNRAYGLGMCVPGTDAQSCSDCIVSSNGRLLQNCTNQTEAIDWRIDRTVCLVRYSNRSFYGSLGMEILRSDNYTRDFQANLTDLEITWEALMIGVIDQASSLYYAAGIRQLESSISRIYSFVQWGRDLSLQNCTKCLQQNVIEYRSCCCGKGGIISRPSCFIRWEIYQFLGFFDNIPRQEVKTMCPCLKFFSALFFVWNQYFSFSSCRWQKHFYRSYCGNCRCFHLIACSRIWFLEEEKSIQSNDN